MQNSPSAAQLIEAVREFLDRLVPELTGHAAFHARVAGNTLDIVQRELDLSPPADAAELERLRALLGQDGSLEALNRELCRRITAGTIGLDTPGLVDHLRTTILAKVAVDQPRYAGYRRALALWGAQAD